jgi:hypothetical protein
MYLCVEDIAFTSFYVFVCWGYRFYLFLCICVLSISVLPLSMYLCVTYIERGKTDILNTQILRKRSNRYRQHTNTYKEVKPISSTHKNSVEDIGFTSFYVFVCWGYRFYLFLCLCVLRIWVLPLSMYVCAQTDILNTQIHKKR